MSQEELAAAADVTVASVRRIEAGSGNPTWATVFAVARAVGLSMTQLGRDLDREMGIEPPPK